MTRKKKGPGGVWVVSVMIDEAYAHPDPYAWYDHKPGRSEVKDLLRRTIGKEREKWEFSRMGGHDGDDYYHFVLKRERDDYEYSGHAMLKEVPFEGRKESGA